MPRCSRAGVILSRVGLVGSLLLLVTLGLLWWFQERLLFFPQIPFEYRTPKENPRGLRSPAEWGYKYDDIELTTRDNIKLHCWLLLNPKPQEVPTFIFFHGNASNLGFHMPHADFLAGGVGANVLVVDYRGFGNSQGVPTEKGVYTDADAALDYILQCQKVNNKDVFLFGHSLGGAVAIDLASRRGDEISGVVVENTFTSLRGALHDVLPFTKGVTWILNMIQRIKLASIDKVRSLKVPILFTSGTDDELIPSSHSEKLYEECGAKTKWRIEVRRGTHNNTYGVGGEKYAAFIREFMETATKATAKAKALAAAAAKEEQQHDLEDAGISTKALAGSALAESSSSSSSRTSTAEAPEADTKAESGGAQTETAAATAGTDAAAAGIKAAATGAAPATAAEAPQVESLLLAGLISGLLLVLLSRQMQKQRSSNSSSSSRASQSASTNAIYDDSQWEEQSSSRYTSKGTEEAQVLLEPAISETSLY